MTYPSPIVRQFATIVTAVSAKVLATIQAAELAQAQVLIPATTVSNIVQINYQFGHLKEIIATMKEWEASPADQVKKYPLVALLLDFPIVRGNSGNYIGDATVQVIIAYLTRPDMKADERYTNNFEPILHPIYYELLEQIEASDAFITDGVNKIRHTAIDHPYYGKGGLSDTSGNVFADTVDAIEVQNLQLRINFDNCS